MEDIYKIPEEEFEKRINKVKKQMSTRNLDMLFVFGTETESQNVRYLSDYWTAFESSAVLISLNSDPLLLIGPESFSYAKSRSMIPDIRRLLVFRESSEPDYPGVKLDCLKHIFEEVSGREKIKRLGIVGLNFMPFPIYKEIKKSLGNTEIIDASDILLSMRMIKSQNEIKLLKKASKIAEIGLKAVLENIRPGMTELQVVGIALKSMYDAGMEHEALTMFVLGGTHSAHAIGRASHKILKEGEIIQLGVPAKIGGYCSSIGRPIVLGYIPKKIKEFLEVGLERENLVISLIREGVELKEVTIKTNEFLRKKGYERYFLYGPAHGIGLVECEHPFVESNSTGIFKENMTFNICAYLGNNQIGQRWEDAIRVVKGGNPPEEFSSYKREIVVIK